MSYFAPLQASPDSPFMMLRKFVRVGLQALRSPEYRGRVRQKLSNTWQDSGWHGIGKLAAAFLPARRPASLGKPGLPSHESGAEQYLAAIRFSQAPHPQWHRPRQLPVQALETGADAPKVIAYYLPQFHPIEVNNQNWGAGFTEWTNVTKALPQYQGHYQPHLPAETGFYDLRNPDSMALQVELARQYGVGGFCFHYYWFGGKRVLEMPLNQFVANCQLDLPFCVCWANENWTRRWDGAESEIILQQNYAPEGWKQFIDDLLPLFNDPRYIRVNGKPLLVVYRPGLIPDTQKVLAEWRQLAEAEGLPGLWLVCAQTFGLVDPRPLGFDAAVEFPPHKIHDRIESAPTPALWNTGFEGTVWNYSDAVGEAMTRAKEPYPLYRTAFPSWDNEARRTANSFSFADANPAEFGEWLSSCASYARETLPRDQQFVFVNAWNEWAEGAHIEPDRHFGCAWLEEVQRLHTARKPVPAALNWSATEPRAPAGPRAEGARTAVVVHLFYVDTWPNLEAALLASGLEGDLLVTTTAEQLAAVTAMVKNRFAHAEVFAVENRGRDIRPLFVLLPLLVARGYGAVLKLHSKKTVHREDGNVWRQSMVASLLPAPQALHGMLESLEHYPSLGLIAPKDSALNLQRFIWKNKAWVAKLAAELGERDGWLDHTRPWFAAGSMFWFKPVALAKLLACTSLQQDLFEAEAGQVDGTLAHALERLMGAAALSAGYHLVDAPTAVQLGSKSRSERRKAEKKWQGDWSLAGRRRIVDSPYAAPTE
ncbi:MAG: glycoside hydrolase family 99-like domain-containing protein [Pseudomonadota bacterium]